MGGEHSISMGISATRLGSSPRGRGTLVQRFAVKLLARIIPAWAGNTDTQPGVLAVRSDHPRVGGEHERVVVRGFDYNGSSPRGRGTQHPLYRAIPIAAGSSPRGRGTPCLLHPQVVPGRIIPAWAGNTATVLGIGNPSSDHPRVGGEHSRALASNLRLPTDHPRVGGEHSSCKPLI